MLLLLYLLISVPAIWQIRELCLLQRDVCDYQGLLDTVSSSWLVAVASALIMGLMVFITAHVAIRARAGTLGIERAEPRRRFKVNGSLVSVVVFALYAGLSFVVLTSAGSALQPFDADDAEAFFWRVFWAVQGAVITLTILWHINEYLEKPASRIVLLGLFLTTLGSIYWIVGLVLRFGEGFAAAT